MSLQNRSAYQKMDIGNSIYIYQKRDIEERREHLLSAELTWSHTIRCNNSRNVNNHARSRLKSKSCGARNSLTEYSSHFNFQRKKFPETSFASATFVHMFRFSLLFSPPLLFSLLVNSNSISRGLLSLLIPPCSGFLSNDDTYLLIDSLLLARIDVVDLFRKRTFLTRLLNQCKIDIAKPSQSSPVISDIRWIILLQRSARTHRVLLNVNLSTIVRSYGWTQPGPGKCFNREQYWDN